MKVSNILFEFEDQSWFPNFLRESMTDYLRLIFKACSMYEPTVPLILDCLNKTNSYQIIDLCSGGGGPVEHIYNDLKKQSNTEINIILTDKFPNIDAYKFIFSQTNGKISFIKNSIDASNVPKDLVGLRTIFSGFHHFSTSYAKEAIKDAVKAKSGIAIFDGGDKNLFFILLILIAHPLGFIFLTPFIKPFRISRIFFTYLIPIIPFCTLWDGIISTIRLRSSTKLLNIARSVDMINYSWKSGRLKNKFGIHIAYLIGFPIG